ncbi:hypothetical protein [Ligilactobacillus agilis]|uniref:hypothetical protein n=1 Tax=Ligilactobacillus agilis TaxID=1601 RepID=UPI0014381CCD|nr:hypothetical protein [Ligilactobacillus agilis]GET16450.1 hypothetical protein NB11A_07410 [Ligilactobacillus agilis]
MESILRIREHISQSLERYQVGSAIFYLAFITYLVGHFMSGTMYILVFGDNLQYRIWLVACLLALFKIILFNSYRTWQDASVVVLIGLVIWASCLNTNSWDMIYYYIMIVAAQDMKFQNIVKVFLTITITLVLITFISAKLGIIMGLTNVRDGSTDLRYALGMVYPTDLAARLFYIELFYVVLRKFKLNLSEYVIWGAVIAFGYIVTNTRLDALLMLMILVVSLLRKQVISVLKRLSVGGISVVAGMGIATIVGITYLYNPNNFILNKIDGVLSGRLHFGHIAFERFNVQFFGQVIQQVGNGGLHGRAYDYFFIDCSYIRVLMMNGLVSFILLMILILGLIRYFLSVKSYTLVLALLFVILSSVIDQHLLEISFNCLFLAVFADITYFKNDELNRLYV